MTRSLSWLLSLSVALLSFSPFTFVSALDFTRLSTGQFPPRQFDVIDLMKPSISYPNAQGIFTNSPPNSFILFGTGSYAGNDVWLSTTRGVTWTQIAGISDAAGGLIRAPAGQDVTSFAPNFAPATTVDALGRLYRISGEVGPNQGCLPEVFTSTNGQRWSRFVVSDSWTPRIYGHAGVDRANNVYLVGGRSCIPGAGQSLFDVWRSTTQGVSWTRQTNQLPVGGPRNAAFGMVYSTFLSRDLMFFFSGWNGATDFNDVWSSSDLGVSWSAVTIAAPWRKRDDLVGIVGSNGVLILIGGKAQATPADIYYNDIWASLDGGYSWGLCQEDASFSDRRYLGAMLDERGFLYIAGGQENEGQARDLSDVWQSSISFFDIPAVSRECKVAAPVCGNIGLSCFPSDAGTRRLPLNQGVECPACGTGQFLDALDFTMQSSAASWSPRASGNIETFPRKLTYTPIGLTTPIEVPAGALILQGNNNEMENDVWISRDFGVTWGLAAGVSMSGRTGLARATAPKDMTSYTPPARNVAFAFDERIGYIYRMGGSLNNQCQNVVQFSSDGLTWSTANSPATNFVNPLREYAGGAVDSQGVVYISGGRTCGVYPNVISLEDVWASRDRGRTWERRTPVGQNAPFGYRLVHVMLAYKTKAPLGNKDILLVLGGWTGGIDRNDIWASSNGGVTFELVTLGASWERRDDMNGEITKEGLIIISGGKQAYPNGADKEYFNDVWVSADGGYTFGQCIKDSSFQDRRYQMTVLDSQGHLIVAGGQQANQALLNDVYRSSFSFSDISAVTKACNLRVPLCGVGLGCLPSSAGFRRLPGNLGVTCTACPAAYAPTNLDFVRLSGEAAWSPRSSGNMEQIMKRISWTNVFGQTLTVPAGAFVMQGNDNHIENDVWISTDQGRDWQLMAGISTGGRSGNARAGGSAAGSSFSPDVSAPAFTLDSFYNIYRISGALGNNGGCLDAVWASMNGGAAWNNQYNLPGSTRHIEPTRELAAAIGDSRGNIFVSGGRSCTANSGEALNDVWMSADKGVNWFRQTASAPWGARLVHQMLSHTSKILNKDVLIVLTGWTGNTDLNDVWASSDQGKSWRQLTAAASWSQRDDANAEITSKGLIVLSSGKNDPYNNGGEVLNDVWVSLDGGYTYGLCNSDAAFEDRRYQMTMFDNEGFLYVAGGFTPDRQDLNDVWKSSYSFDDVQSVQANCGVRIPRCGVGLNCWPTSPGFKILNGNRGATCNACDNPIEPEEMASSSSTGAASGSISEAVANLSAPTLFGIALMILVVGAGAALAYRYWNNLDEQNFSKLQSQHTNRESLLSSSSNELASLPVSSLSHREESKEASA